MQNLTLGNLPVGICDSNRQYTGGTNSPSSRMRCLHVWCAEWANKDAKKQTGVHDIDRVITQEISVDEINDFTSAECIEPVLTGVNCVDIHYALMARIDRHCYCDVSQLGTAAVLHTDCHRITRRLQAYLAQPHRRRVVTLHTTRTRKFNFKPP